MKLKTIRVHRSRPSTLAAALALMLTMLIVYLLSLPAQPQDETTPAAMQTNTAADVRMEGMELHFECEGRYANLLDARVAAAQCVQAGGAGLILPDGNQYAVIRSAGTSASSENTLHQSAAGLTLKLSGAANEITAIADAVAFLYAQATETAGLARSLESGEASAATLETLLQIYRTKGEKILSSLQQIRSPGMVANRLTHAVQAALDRLAAPATPSGARLLHAAAGAEWISMLQEFTSA